MRDETSDGATGLLNRPARQGASGKQALVVRQGESGFERELLERLARLERNQQAAASGRMSGTSADHSASSRLDVKTIVAAGAIVLSLAGYVIQDARNSSREDTEIETTKVRVTNLERISQANTEGRIRTEVQLSELREGQAEIKRLIEAHDVASRGQRRK